MSGETLPGFPTINDLPEETRQLIQELKVNDLPRRPRVDAETEATRRHFKKVLLAESLPTVSAEDLHSLANSQKAGNTGNQQSFNVYWNKVGKERAAAEMRAALKYLLYGVGELEDRLTHLIQGTTPHAMTGLKEGIAVKALCMVHPDRFLPILYYSGGAGKKEIAQALFNIELPNPDKARYPIGKLIVESNDLLVQIVRPEYDDLERAGGFLWDAYHQISPPNPAARARGVVVAPNQSFEFTCTKCNLVKPKTQMGDEATMRCRDCA